LKEIANRAVAEAERRAVRLALHATWGNKSEAARLLRVDCNSRLNSTGSRPGSSGRPDLGPTVSAEDGAFRSTDSAGRPLALRHGCAAIPLTAAPEFRRGTSRSSRPAAVHPDAPPRAVSLAAHPLAQLADGSAVRSC